MNRIDRLTGIILLLQSHRVVTAEFIATHYEISVRTVYRDIAALGEAGVPIVAEAGVGYSLMRGYHVPPVMFTEHEAAALFMSGEVTEQIADDSLRDSLRSALLKIRSVLPSEKRDYLSRLKQTMSVRLQAPGSLQISHQALMPLQHAVVQKNCVFLHYNTANRGAISERTVEPLGVIFYSRQWHLIAHCRMRGEVRDFRLDRISQWDVLAETFTGHENFSMAVFLEELIQSHELVPVVLLAKPEAMERVRQFLLGTSITEIRQLDGWIRVEALSWSLDWVASSIMSYPDEVKAVSPPLRGRIHEMAKALLAAYSEESEKFSEAETLLT